MRHRLMILLFSISIAVSPLAPVVESAAAETESAQLESPAINWSRRTTSGMDSDAEIQQASRLLTVQFSSDAVNAVLNIYDLWEPAFSLNSVSDRILSDLDPKTVEILGAKLAGRWTRCWLAILVTAHQGFREAAQSQIEWTFVDVLTELNQKRNDISESALDEALADLMVTILSEGSRLFAGSQSVLKDRVRHQLRLFVSRLKAGGYVSTAAMSKVYRYDSIDQTFLFFSFVGGWIASMVPLMIFAKSVGSHPLVILGAGFFGGMAIGSLTYGSLMHPFQKLRLRLARKSLKVTRFDQVAAACEQYLLID